MEIIMKKMSNCEFDDQELLKLVNALGDDGQTQIAAFLCFANALRLLIKKGDKE